MEVDPRTQRLYGQLLHGAVPIHLERRHAVHQGGGHGGGGGSWKHGEGLWVRGGVLDIGEG